MTQQVMSTLKGYEKRSHSAVGEHVDELWAVYTVSEIAEHKYLGCRYYINGIIGNSCQWGQTDSIRIAKELGLVL